MREAIDQKIGIIDKSALNLQECICKAVTQPLHQKQTDHIGMIQVWLEAGAKIDEEILLTFLDHVYQEMAFPKGFDQTAAYLTHFIKNPSVKLLKTAICLHTWVWEQDINATPDFSPYVCTLVKKIDGGTFKSLIDQLSPEFCRETFGGVSIHRNGQNLQKVYGYSLEVATTLANNIAEYLQKMRL